jgi:uncharacterized integral membrane protein (TIGR00697 family)
MSVSVKTLDKKSRVYFILAVFFITNALLAEIIGVKIFSLEKLFGIEPAQSSLIEGFSFHYNLSAGVVMWPLVFIISDIINEYFGRKGVIQLSLVGMGLVAYSFALIYVVTVLPPADFWISANASGGFDINYAFSKLFTQSMSIMVASLTAFMVGQIIDAYTFQYFKKLTQSKKLWLRATASTVLSQLVDSFLILYIAFYWLGSWSLAEVINVGVIQYSYKITVAVMLIPILELIHRLIDNYLDITHFK